MRIGFTGTRNGLTPAQKEKVRALLRRVVANALEEDETIFFHHGDCVGADAEAHDIARGISPNIVVVVHPPESDGLRAYRTGDETRLRKPFLTRNKDIVETASLLIACPEGPERATGSGTWATIRMARTRGVNHIVIDPQGRSM